MERALAGRFSSGKHRKYIVMSAKAESSPMMQMDFRVANKLGLHARPAAQFVKTASQFSCDIFVHKDGEKANGKSLISLLLLSAGPGSNLTVRAHGSDAPQALAELGTLVARRFGEEE